MARAANVTDLIEWTGDRRRPQDLGLDRNATPETVRTHVSGTTEDLTVLLRLVTDPHASVRAAAYANPVLPLDVLTFLSRRGDTSLWHLIVAHPNADLAVIEEIISAGANEHVARAALLRIPSRALPHDREVVGDRWREVCDLIAETHPELVSEVAQRLCDFVPNVNAIADHPLRAVRLLIAQRGDASRETLKNYLESSDAELVYLAASHPSWNDKDVEAFADDHRLEVRLAAAAHLNATEAALTRLADRDQPDEVRERVAANPSAPGHLLDQLATPYPLYVGANVSAPAETLARLVGLGEVDVRRVIASNPSCPSGMLTLLAGSPDRETRERVAANPGASTEASRWAQFKN